MRKETEFVSNCFFCESRRASEVSGRRRNFSGSAIPFFTRSPLQMAGGSSMKKLELPTQALRLDRSMDPQADLVSRKNSALAGF